MLVCTRFVCFYVCLCGSVFVHMGLEFTGTRLTPTSVCGFRGLTMFMCTCVHIFLLAVSVHTDLQPMSMSYLDINLYVCVYNIHINIYIYLYVHIKKHPAA